MFGQMYIAVEVGEFYVGKACMKLKSCERAFNGTNWPTPIETFQLHIKLASFFTTILSIFKVNDKHSLSTSTVLPR